jgi:predicted DNA-binding protein YlxM (UPF0122 family)
MMKNTEKKQRLSGRLLNDRNKIICDLWKTKIWSMTELGEIFKISNAVVLEVIKNWHEKKEMEVLDVWYKKQLALYEAGRLKVNKNK